MTRGVCGPQSPYSGQGGKARGMRGGNESDGGGVEEEEGEKRRGEGAGVDGKRERNEVKD